MFEDFNPPAVKAGSAALLVMTDLTRVPLATTVDVLGVQIQTHEVARTFAEIEAVIAGV